MLNDHKRPENIKYTISEGQGDVLQPPHSPLTPAVVKSNISIKDLSFGNKNSEQNTPRRIPLYGGFCFRVFIRILLFSSDLFQTFFSNLWNNSIYKNLRQGS